MLTQAHPLGNPWTNISARLEDERIMLQRIAAGEPLAEVLEHVLRAVEAQSSVPLRTSILFVDEGGILRAGVAPSLPAEYLAAIDGAPIGPEVASWGRAAYQGEPVYIEDIASHPSWAEWREHALPLGLRACWSSPIKRPNGRLLGVFSNYYEQPRLPSSHDIEAIALVTRTAALAIERHHTEEALRQSAQRWRSMFEGMQEGFFLAEAMRDRSGRIHDFRLLEVNPAFEEQCSRRIGTSVGRTLHEVFRRAPPQVFELFMHSMLTGEPVQAEYGVPGSTPAWYEVRARREGEDRLMAMQLDISARKQVEKKLSEEQHHKSFQLSLGDQLRSLELPSLIEQAACEALGRHLALSEVYLVEAGRSQGEFHMITGWAGTGAPAAIPSAVCAVVQEAIDTACSVRLPAGIGDGLAVPLGRWGRLGSALIARSDRSGWMRPADWSCIEEAAERLCDAAERAAHPLQLQERVEQAVAERDRIWRLSPEILGVMDRQGRLLNVSPAVRAILGWTPQQFLSMGFSSLLHPDDREDTQTALNRALAGAGGLHHMENRLRKHDGDYSWITWSMSAAQDHLYLTGRDDTDLKAQAEALSEAEAALRQAQKLEAVGRLTEGISHDFNNMLQGISGALYLIERRLGSGDLPAARRYLGMASDACDRAAQLTQRLLTFSRQQPIDPRPCDPGDVLRSMVELFRRYTGEHVTLEFDLQANLWPVCCDVNQFESVVLNLVINACDAIAEEGGITLRTRNVILDRDSLRQFPQAAPGEFVELAVTDTGCGMSPEVLAHTFEPFFTTKPIGAGTGLGLSTSYGFAQQAGGAVAIESQPGEGTTVRLWLPRHRGRHYIEIERFAPLVREVRDPAPHAVVFLAEDDDAVREMAIEAIARLDVTVLCACDGTEAAKRLGEAGRLDLLVTDIGLPGMNGRDLAAVARRNRPDLPVLFMTGYAENMARDPSFLDGRMDLIVKPFALEVFASRVQAMLAAHAWQHPAGGVHAGAP